LTGKLRIDSGASINPSEFATSFPTLFPMQGDSPQLVADKQRYRARVIEGNIVGLPPSAKQRLDQMMQEDQLNLSDSGANVGTNRGSSSPSQNGGHWGVGPDGRAMWVED
jgi:hypothetical protein